MRSTRHRSGAAGIAMLVALAVAVAACAGSAGPTSPASDTPGGASAPPSVGPSSAPVETAPPATPPQSEPPPSPSDSEAPPESAAPSDSPETNGAAAACTGTDNNRDFYADAATALDFAVYCPVLPRGWFVDQGEYTLRNGGMLHITYKGPNGAALELVERGPCGSGDDCIPSGTEEGQASFGDLPAEVVALDDGRLAIVAEEVGVGQWWIIGRGVDEPTLTEIASDLARVGG